MNTKADVENFLSQKKLAVVGASESGKKFGNSILKELSAKGFEILPVHRSAKEINGFSCFNSINELPGDTGGLIISVKAADTMKIVEEAHSTGIKNIWIQKGSGSKKAEEFCLENDINLVNGKCVFMFADPKGVHRFHRFLMELFGKLPK